MDPKMLPHHHGEHTEELLEHMPNTEQCMKVADVFKLVGDGTRLKIFLLLCHCEECVSNIAAAMDMTDPAVSHHLKLLKQGNLLQSRRDGKEIYYKAAATDEAKLLHVACEEMFQIRCPFEAR